MNEQYMKENYAGYEGTYTLLKTMQPNEVHSCFNEFMYALDAKPYTSRNAAKLWTRMIRGYDKHNPRKLRGRNKTSVMLLKDNGYSNKDCLNYLTRQGNNSELEVIVKDLRGK